MANAAVGNEPDGKLVAFPSLKKGAEKSSLNCTRYGNGRTSNMPKPALRDVFPSRKGSHEKPTRGSKLRSVGLENNGSPRCGCVSARVRTTGSLPSASLGTVAIS